MQASLSWVLVKMMMTSVSNLSEIVTMDCKMVKWLLRMSQPLPNFPSSADPSAAPKANLTWGMCSKHCGALKMEQAAEDATTVARGC